MGVMKSSIHEAATTFNSISLFAFSAFSEVPEFCLLELENLSLELSSQLWDSKRPGKSENADWAVSQNQMSTFFWFQRCSWSALKICTWRVERKRCPYLLSGTASSSESFISLSSCCCWQNCRSRCSGTSFSRAELQMFSWAQAMKHSWII